MSLQLSNFDQTGHDPDALALIVAAAAPDLYMDSDRGGTQSPESGELGLGSGETRISGIRLLSGNRIALNDNNLPSSLSLSDWFGGAGASSWTLHIQTDDGEVSTSQIQSSGGDVVRWQFTAAAAAVLNGIAAGDRVIIAVTRPTQPVAAQFSGAMGAIAAALIKRAPSNRPIAAQIAGAAGTLTAALGKIQPSVEPRAALAASVASVEAGRAVELRWAASDAGRVVIAALPGPDLGEVPPSGSLRTYPRVSTTWTLTAYGAAGTTPATAAVTVAVEPRATFGPVSLLPPNATPFERALEAALAQDVDIPIRKLWSSADCPVDMLPWLAWALGVEEWDSDWPEPVKRAAVSNAIAVHREKGTLAGLKRVLDTAGAEYEYVERPAGVPMTAKLSILNSNAVYLPDVARAVNRVKRASLDLDIELLSAAAGQIPVAAGLGAATVVEIEDWGGF